MVLRRAVGVMERVVVGHLREFLRGSPRRVKSAHQMSAVERVVLINVIPRLLVLIKPWIKDPLIGFSLDVVENGPVDVDGSEEREASLLIHYNTVMMIRQDVFFRTAGGFLIDASFCLHLGRQFR